MCLSRWIGCGVRGIAHRPFSMEGCDRSWLNSLSRLGWLFSRACFYYHHMVSRRLPASLGRSTFVHNLTRRTQVHPARGTTKVSTLGWLLPLPYRWGLLSDRLHFYILANRLASFYISSVVLGGFSAVLTYAITLLGGEHGIAAWRWIFVSVPPLIQNLSHIQFSPSRVLHSCNLDCGGCNHNWFRSDRMVLPSRLSRPEQVPYRRANGDHPIPSGDRSRRLSSRRFHYPKGLWLPARLEDLGFRYVLPIFHQKGCRFRRSRIDLLGLMHFCSTIPVYAIK